MEFPRIQIVGKRQLPRIADEPVLWRAFIAAIVVLLHRYGVAVPDDALDGLVVAWAALSARSKVTPNHRAGRKRQPLRAKKR